MARGASPAEGSLFAVSDHQWVDRVLSKFVFRTCNMMVSVFFELAICKNELSDFVINPLAGLGACLLLHSRADTSICVLSDGSNLPRSAILAPRVPKIHVDLCCLNPWMGGFRQSDLGVPHFFEVLIDRMNPEKFLRAVGWSEVGAEISFPA